MNFNQVAAEQEEARIRQTQAEKEAKLKKFRENVKNRVRLMEKARKQKEQEKSYTAVSFDYCVIHVFLMGRNALIEKYLLPVLINYWYPCVWYIMYTYCILWWMQILSKTSVQKYFSLNMNKMLCNKVPSMKLLHQEKTAVWLGDMVHTKLNTHVPLVHMVRFLYRISIKVSACLFICVICFLLKQKKSRSR